MRASTRCSLDSWPRAAVEAVEPLPLPKARLIEPLQAVAVQLIDARHVHLVQLVEPLHDRVDRAEPSSQPSDCRARGGQAARGLGRTLRGRSEAQRAWADPEIGARMSEAKKRNGPALPPMTDAERKLDRTLQPIVGGEAALAEVFSEDKAA